MNPLLVAALFLVNTMLMPLVVELVKERAPGGARRLIGLATRLLPEAHRERYREEWTAELEEMERQNVGQLLASVRIVLGAPSVGRTLRARDRRDGVGESDGVGERLASAVPYVGYLSYSHAADGTTATLLRRSVARFATPWYRRRGLSIFGGDKTLSRTPLSWQHLQKALDSSDYFILLASPRAARSPWVHAELTRWLQRRGADRLVIVLTEGDIRWDAENGDFDWELTTSLPAVLRGALTAEPLWLDLRGALHKRTDLRFADVVASVAAVLRGMGRSEISEQDRGFRRRAAMLFRVVVALNLVLLALLFMAFFV